LGNNNVLMMRNHGPIVVGPTVAAAFDRLYYLEESCQRQLLAMSAQRPLSKVAGEIAQALAEQVPVFDAYAEKHLTAIKRVLDREEPEYAT
jgi:ribulose-5-phosphate 4-epimerase/fuculose-1-phosphate aldolase